MAAGAYIFGCKGPLLSPDEAAFFRQADPFGFILFARNIKTPQQVSRLTGELRAAVGRDALIFIDQEGGRVARMRAPHWRQWSAPMDQAGGARAFWLRYRIIAAELRAVGIDANCAPLADIADPHTHAVLRNRCYGSDVRTVTTRAQAVAQGLMAGGVLPVLKHMPGHGRARRDSHLDLPRVAASSHALYDRDFAPFRALAHLPIAMTAHLVFSAYDSLPATHSPVMIDVIRDHIGFAGLLLTDDISMQALSGTVAERGQAALGAGCDIVLHCNGDLAEMAAVAALGPMRVQSRRRAEAALDARKAPDLVDIDALQAEFDAISARPN